ncbi:MAG: SpoIIE family protein phosphatase [Clostridia bacterium]|nr:SpoIIE family protein phosphatase [Clostridia bacterium]
MLDSTYKKILDKMPVGVFVFDGKFRVKYTNEAFRRAFKSDSKKGLLNAVVGCEEQGGCGRSEGCAYCSFYKVASAANETGTEQTETLQTTLTKNGRVESVAVRIRVYPLEKGKLYLGFTESSRQSEMEREMLSAGQLQRRLLPEGKSKAGVPYSYLYIPYHAVGGDMTDVYEHDGAAYGVIADVSGKGVSGGMLSAFVKAGWDKKETSLASAMQTLSSKFNELNQDECSYVTVAGVRIDRERGELTYSSAGHNAPILLKTEYGIHEIELPAPPISNWIDDFPYAEKTMPISKGDLLVLVTDGVTESKNRSGEMFGIERVENVMMQSSSADDFIKKLKAALGVFCSGSFNDDVTALAFDI